MPPEEGTDSKKTHKWTACGKEYRHRDAPGPQVPGRFLLFSDRIPKARAEAGEVFPPSLRECVKMVWEFSAVMRKMNLI